jgi:lysophospholipase L1-like esterase
LAIFLGLVVALGLDFVVRQIYVKIRKKPPVDKPGLRIPDPLFHHAIKPSSKGVDIFGPYSAPYFSNSLGLRDAEIRNVPLVGAIPRILFIGDSFTEAGPIPWEKTFVGRVANELKPKGIEVLNAGVASYCPTTERVKLRYLLETQGLKVDRVVLCLDISDLKDEFYYEEGADGKVLQVAYGPFREKAKKLQRAEAICGWLETRVEKNFVILGAIIRNSRLTWRRHASSTGVVEYDAIPEWAYNWPDYRGPYEGLVEKGLARTKSEMTLLAQELKRLGVPLTLVVYPWPQQVKAGTRPSRCETEWSRWAQVNNAQFVSLFPVFVNKEPGSQVIAKYYWKNDAHWNEEGHRLVADALLRPEGGIFLPKKGVVESKPQAGK